RTVPMTSKVTGVNLIELATAILIDKPLRSLVKETGMLAENLFYTIKAPIFSTNKLPGVDPKLVPEMKSTGELIARSYSFEGSLTKSFVWNEEIHSKYLKEDKHVFIADRDEDIKALEDGFKKLGIKISSSEDIAIEEWLKKDGIFALYSSKKDYHD